MTGAATKLLFDIDHVKDRNSASEAIDIGIMNPHKTNKVWHAARLYFKKLVAGVWHSTGAAIMKLPGRIMAHRLNFFMAIGVMALVFGFRIMPISTRTAHLQDMATELGTVAEFWGEPVPNKDGSKIVFEQSTETGVGLFLFDRLNGTKKKLYEQNALNFEKNRQQLRFVLWGWSPDDRQFIYSRSPDGKANQLVACDGDSGQATATLTLDKSMSDGVWLSPSTFAYADARADLFKMDQTKDKQWTEPASFRKPKTKKATHKVKGLVALAQDTVAWQEGQAIWAWKFDAADPKIIWETKTNMLLDFSLDASGTQLLLHFREKDGESFASWSLKTQQATDLGRVSTTAFLTNKVVWFQGLQFACLEGYADDNILHIGAAGKELPFDGGINSFVGTEDGLYVTGSRSGEPSGIWKYDEVSDSLSCVVSNSQSAYRYAKAVTPLRASFTNEAGIVISYRLWSPPHSSPDKKYPLLIGWASSRWNSYPAVAANGGAYFASIEKEKDRDWRQKALPLYEHLKATLNIDPENLFLYGTSAQSPMAVQVFETKPEIWKGVVLFNPVALPDLDFIKPSHKIFMDFGVSDTMVPKIMRFQDAAARAGILTTGVRHENEQHVYRTTTAIASRDKALMTFLFNP